MTRFKIFYAVFIISRYCSNLRQKHVKLIIELFYYMKKTIDYNIIYQTNDSFFLNYVDSDFIRIVNDKCFIIKWIFYLLTISFFEVLKNKTSSYYLLVKSNIMLSTKSKKNDLIASFFCRNQRFFRHSNYFFCK